MHPHLRHLLLSTPAWVLQGAALDFDFENARYYQQGQSRDPLQLLTVSRASTGYVDDVLGNWTSIGNNLPRIGRGKGLLVEEARTNVVLWNRDLTNAAWTKSNVTAALNQTGIDGSANSASSLTATAGNGTALQGITLASSARWQTAFVKRITGSGVVEMTMDNGSTWTAVADTSSWTRVAIPTQTLANPTVGFRIVTSGDAIAVDFVQNENSGSFATSPILVTTVAVARALDVVTAARVSSFGAAASVLGSLTPLAPLSFATNQTIVQIDDGSANNRIQIARTSSTNSPAGLTMTSGGAQTIGNTGVTWATGSKGRVVAGVANVDQGYSFNGSSVSVLTSAFPLSLDVVRIGANSASGAIANGYFGRIALWQTARLPDADLPRFAQ